MRALTIAISLGNLPIVRLLLAIVDRCAAGLFTDTSSSSLFFSLLLLLSSSSLFLDPRCTRTIADAMRLSSQVGELFIIGKPGGQMRSPSIVAINRWKVSVVTFIFYYLV